MKPYIVILFVLLLLSGTGNTVVQAQSDMGQKIVEGRKNANEQKNKPYVILISADGFRYDYPEKYKADHLLRLSSEGVRAASMIPGYPSVTFPNHYSIATGQYPAHHGLVNNTFYDAVKGANYSMGDKPKVGDGSWYGGTPLWVLAEQQQLLSASMFWVGSEAAIKNTRPTYYYNFNDKMPVADRIAAVKNWLQLPEESRPHLITFYLSEPDHAGHRYGPNAPQTSRAVKEVDSIIHLLTSEVASTGLPVNFIFLADHGMTAVDTLNPIPMPSAIDPSKFIIPSSGTTMVLHAKNKADIQPTYEQLKREEKYYTAYLRDNMPANLHYSAKDDSLNRIGDILLLPEWPRVFSARKPGAGYHGFDPYTVKDMHATFMAWGPAFKKGIRVNSFENIHVYPLIATILGLQYQADNIDGKIEVLREILK